MWDNLQAGQRILKGMNAMERRKENKSRVTMTSESINTNCNAKTVFPFETTQRHPNNHNARKNKR